jgi:hypothetical protein
MPKILTYPVFVLATVLQDHALYFFVYVPLWATMLSLVVIAIISSDMQARISWSVGMFR